MTGTVVFSQNKEPGTISMYNWLRFKVVPTVDSTYFFNDDSDKTFPLFAGQENEIYVIEDSTLKVTFNFGTGTASIQAM